MPPARRSSTTKSTARSASKPAARKASKPAARSASKPAARSASKPASRSASKPAARSATKPAARATRAVRARASSTSAATRREVELSITRFEKRLDDANDALATLGKHLGRSAQSSYKEVTTALRSLRRQRALKFPGFHAPRTSDELAAALEADPDAVLLAGGTDIGLWVTQQLRDLPSIIYIGEIAELKRIRSEAAGIVIGAAVPLTEGWGAIVAAYPQLAELAQRFGSPPVRNSGTLCGNIANGSPIGDAMPALIALGAAIELRRGEHTRHLPLDRFYLGYQRKDLARGEFVASVTVPAPRAGQRLASYKLSKRIDQDISAVCAAFAVEQQGDRIVAARIAFGGLAAIPARARATEAALIGRPWTQESIEVAAAALAEDFQPLTDLRASCAYRLQAAGNLLRRFYFEAEGSAVPVRTAALAAATR